jgi:hypothetical protein
MEEIEGVVNSDYEEIKLNKYREVVCFSVFFSVFLAENSIIQGIFSA